MNAHSVHMWPLSDEEKMHRLPNSCLCLVVLSDPSRKVPGLLTLLQTAGCRRKTEGKEGLEMGSANEVLIIHTRELEFESPVLM